MKKYTRCKKCNRILKDSRSKAVGYGPTCLARINEEKKLERRRLFDGAVSTKEKEDK